jgi:hypothetical protein
MFAASPAEMIFAKSCHSLSLPLAADAGHKGRAVHTAVNVVVWQYFITSGLENQKRDAEND